MTQQLRLGIAGLGTVGTGVVKIIRSKAALLAARTGTDSIITAVSARDKTKARGVPRAGLGRPAAPVRLARPEGGGRGGHG